MAIITGHFANNSKNCYPYIEYSYTQDVANNTSTITVKLYVKKLNGYATSWQGSCACNVKIDGAVAWSATQRVDLRPIGVGASLYVGGATRTINHNADGSRAVSVSGYVGLTSISLGAGNVSGTVYFPTIPRKTQVRTEGPTTFGSTITIYHAGASGAFTHSIGAWMNGRYKEIGYSVGGTSTQWTIPNDWMTALPDSSEGRITIVLDTLVNGQVIGTSETSFAAQVPDWVKPSIGDITLSDLSSKPSGVTGFWQNYSQLRVVVNASGSYGSSPVKYRVRAGQIDQTRWGNTIDTGKLWWNGSFDIIVDVTDSRGRTVSKTFAKKLEVISYIPPAITKLEYERMENTEGSERPSNLGTIGYITYAISWHGTSTNRSVRFLWKTKAQTSYPNSIDMSGYQNGITKHNFSRNLSSADAYILRLEVKDHLQMVVHQIEMTNIFPLISMNPQGTGLAFGKEAIDDYLLDCAMGIQMAPDKRIRKHGVNSSWTQGCKGLNALFYMDTHDGYNPLFAQKTDIGAWALGVNNHDAWRFTFMKDVDINNGSNYVHCQYVLPISFAGTFEILGAETNGRISRANIIVDTQGSANNGYQLWGSGLTGSLTTSGNAMTLFSNKATQIGGFNRFNDIVIFSDYIETNQRLFARKGVFTDTISYNSWDGWNGTWCTGCMSHFVPTSTERYCGTEAHRWQGFYSVNPVNVSSDKRMKENIEYMYESEAKIPMSLIQRATTPITSEDLLAFIRDDLKIASYDYKIDDTSLTKEARIISEQHRTKQVGFIAQDIVNTKVGATIITKDPDGMLSYETGNYMSVIAGALQEEIKIRERELQDAKNTLSLMRADIEALRLEVQNKSIK